jgi:hypothetical protein
MTTVQDLARQIRAAGRPDTILAIARGGLIPATLLAHALGARDVRVVLAQHTRTDDRNAATLPMPTIANTAGIGDLSARRVLIVDDVITTGATMAAVRRVVFAANAKSAESVVLTAKCTSDGAPGGGSAHPPVDYLGLLCAGWVAFPWETNEG